MLLIVLMVCLQTFTFVASDSENNGELNRSFQSIMEEINKCHAARRSDNEMFAAAAAATGKQQLEGKSAGSVKVVCENFYLVCDGESFSFSVPIDDDEETRQRRLNEKIVHYLQRGFKNIECLPQAAYVEKYFNVSAERINFVQGPKTQAQKDAEESSRASLQAKNDALAAQRAAYDEQEKAKRDREQKAATNKAAREEVERIRQEQVAVKEIERKRQELERNAAAHKASQDVVQEKSSVLETLRQKGLPLYDLKEKAQKYNSARILALIENVFTDIDKQRRLLSDCKPKDFRKVFSQNRMAYDQIDTAIVGIQDQIREFEQSLSALVVSSGTSEVRKVTKGPLLQQVLGQTDTGQGCKKQVSIFTEKNYDCFCLNSRPAILGPDTECSMCQLKHLSVLDPNAAEFIPGQW
jgi:hypothetical protein